MEKNKVQALMLASLFGIPLLLFAFFWTFSTPVFNPIPVMHTLEANGDTTWHFVADFEGIDQFGKPFSHKELDGNVYIIHVIESSADSFLNDVVNSQMIKMLENVKDVEYIKLLTLSSDTVPELKLMADSLYLNTDRWKFVSLPQEKIQEIITEGMRFEDAPAKPKPFTSRMVALVDKEGKVRGYYDLARQVLVRDLKGDLRALLTIEYKSDFE